MECNPQFIMIGKKFGKLTVIEKTKKDGRTLYLCICDCGNKRYLTGYSITSGNNKSCGCIRFKKQGFEAFMSEYRAGGTLREAEIKTGYPRALAYRYNKEEVSQIARIRREQRKKPKKEKPNKRLENNKKSMRLYASLIEYFVCNPDKTLIEISKHFGISHGVLTNILKKYFKPFDGETITLQSKIND